MSGWFAVKHGITRHPMFKGRPDRLAIWLWLLDNAAWKDTTRNVRGETIDVPRGSVCAGERQVAAGAGVGRQVVRAFLSALRAEGMITQSSTHRRNVITICNYDKYQNAVSPANPLANPVRQSTHRTTRLATHRAGGKPDMSQSVTDSGIANQPTEQPTDQPIKEQENTSVAKATGRVDPAAIVFGHVLAWLIEATGKSERSARTVIGGWRKRQSDAEIIEACGQAQREGALDPVAFVEGCFKRRLDRRELSVAEDLERRGFRDLENDRRNFSRGGDQRPPTVRHSADDVPGVLRFPAQEDRPVPERDVRVGPDFDPLLALPEFRSALA